MQGYRFRLGDHSSPTIADRRRIVHDVLDDLGARRAQDGVRHLVDDGIHGIFNDRERHGINRYGHTDSELISMTILPIASACALAPGGTRSEEHTSELQSLMRISYAVFCLK